MNSSKKHTELSPQELSQWIDENKSFYLIDILGNEHFQLIHLPGALNACVFEVTFIDQVKAITKDKDATIVLYGSSNKSMDSLTANEKLLVEGYNNILILKGGIEAWRESSQPLEGSDVDKHIDPRTLLKLKPENKKYQVDIEQSIIQWTGRNQNSNHIGSVKITDGEIIVRNGEISGKFNIDMNSIENFNLKGDELEPVLISHLKSDDFFLTKLFPKATFEILNAKPITEPFLTIPNFEIKGRLSLRGMKVSQDFMATVTDIAPNGLIAEAHFDIDRTRWGIIYGSTRFFEHLGMHLVFDQISIQIKITAFS